MRQEFRSVALGLAVIAGTPLTATEISEELRGALEKPLDRRVRELFEERNDVGVNNVRGSYMKRFRELDDGSYEVIFHTRTAETDTMNVQRYRLTLRPDGKDWVIVDEVLEREYTGKFFRSVPGDETFHAFDSFSFGREGIELASGAGTLYLDYRRGKPSFLRMRASGMSYSYAPPADTGHGRVFEVFKKRYRDTVAFTPEEFSISCSTADCEVILSEAFTNLREITRDDLDSNLRETYDERQKEMEKSRAANPLGGFARVTRSGNRWWSAAVKQKGEVHWVRLAYDNLDAREVTYWVGGKGTLYEYHATETRNSGIPAATLERRPDRSRMDYEIVSLTGSIDLALDGPEAMRADLTYRLRILQPLEMVYFSIANIGVFRDDRQESRDPTLELELIEDGQGEELSFVKFGGTTGFVLLPEKLTAGDELDVRIKYKNENGIYKLNAHYSYVSRSGWLPFVQFGDMIDTWDLTFRAPRRYRILSVGRLEDSARDARLTTARFVADSPIQFPTVIFGDYAEDSSRIEVTRSDGVKVPVNVYVDEFSMSSAGFGIRANALRPVADQAANSLNLFQEILGTDYPHRKLDVVNAVFQDPLSGQSPASIVYLGGAVFRATGTVAQSVWWGDSTSVSRFMETVVAHEVGHQWWGGAVAPSNRRNYWFVESLAEYMAALYVENLYAAKDPLRGWQKYLGKVDGWRYSIMKTDLMTSVKDSDSMWQGTSPRAARTRLIYDYGPYAFHILRMTFRDYQGDSGDAKFFNFLRLLSTELQGKEIVTSDIQRVAESAFGGVGPDGTPYHADMSWFFDQWIRGVGIPELTLDVDTRQAEDGNYIVQGTIGQRIVVGKDREPLPGKTYRGIVLVKVDTGKQDFRVPVALNGPETPFGFKVPLKPRRVTINDSHEILAYRME